MRTTFLSHHIHPDFVVQTIYYYTELVFPQYKCWRYLEVELGVSFAKHNAKKTYGEVEVQLHAFLTAAVDGDECLSDKEAFLKLSTGAVYFVRV
jgi:hypothetical protein